MFNVDHVPLYEVENIIEKIEERILCFLNAQKNRAKENMWEITPSMEMGYFYGLNEALHIIRSNGFISSLEINTKNKGEV